MKRLKRVNTTSTGRIAEPWLSDHESVNRFQIRTANPVDAEAIIKVHYAAVHQTAVGFYPSGILEAWSAKPGETRYQWMRILIANGDEIVMVAEVDSCILGFGIIFPKVEELRALYVHPGEGRRGIGRKILQALEARMTGHGVSRIWLNASLNAEPFYRSNGYTTVSPGKFRLSAGLEMDCMNMEKHFGPRLNH
jgi:GNAT superfamily N-acetyltransferase